MNIALIGYGKMGQAIERIALTRGHQVTLKITSRNQQDLSAENLAGVDVAIEFTGPASALKHVALCLNAGIPVICGTTGWNEQLEEAKALAHMRNTGFLQASNFSIGVNIFFEINKLLARLIGTNEAYSATIEEVHHLQKKDAPSGTAITLAEQILLGSQHLKAWALTNDGLERNLLPITALRTENVPGTHVVAWSSEADTIEIKHIAHSRDGFALGAVLAAEFIPGKSGVFTMCDVLAI